MKLQFKGREAFLIFIIFVGWVSLGAQSLVDTSLKVSNNPDTSRLKIIQHQLFEGVQSFLYGTKDSLEPHFYFESKEQALDTLIFWMLMKKPSMASGYLPKIIFINQWRSHDTAALLKVIEGNWLTYQFLWKKSLKKTVIQLKRSKVNFKMVEVVPRPRVTISVAGDGITKYEYTIKYKKLRYILCFQLWWIGGRGYWVNDVTWSLGV